ncbi:MAG: O-antigen ligase family protein [Pseudobdellovibrio sp.]
MIYSLSSFISPGTEAGFLNQLLGIVLFLFLALSVYTIITKYLKDIYDNSFILVSSLVIVVFLVFSFYFLSALSYKLYFLGLVLSLVCALGLYHPAIAIGNTVSFLILRPWELISDEDSLMILPRGVFLLFIMSFIIHCIRTKKIRINTNKYQLLFVGLGLWVFLSTLVSGHIAEAQSEFFEAYLKSLVLGLLIFQGVNTDEDYEYMLQSILVAVFGVSLFALINTFFIIDGDRLEGRGAIQNANDLAAILIFAVPMSLKSILRKQVKPLEWFFSGFMLIALALGVWKAQSRAAYLALMAMFGSHLVYRFRANRKVLMSLSAVAIVGVAIVSQLSLGRDTSDLDESKMNRLGYWKAGISMALRNPALGVGFTQFPNNYQKYGAADFTEHGKRTAHSSWVLLVAEAGFPALILVGLLFFYALKKAWFNMKVAPELLLALVGYGVCMTFLSHIYAIYPYVLFALVLSYPDQSDRYNKV